MKKEMIKRILFELLPVISVLTLITLSPADWYIKGAVLMVATVAFFNSIQLWITNQLSVEQTKLIRELIESVGMKPVARFHDGDLIVHGSISVTGDVDAEGYMRGGKDVIQGGPKLMKD